MARAAVVKHQNASADRFGSSSCCRTRPKLPCQAATQRAAAQLQKSTPGECGGSIVHKLIIRKRRRDGIKSIMRFAQSITKGGTLVVTSERRLCNVYLSR